VSPLGSIALGAVAGALSATAVGLKYRFGYDDSLDVVGVHLVAGLWGTVAIGLLATDTGLLYGGGLAQLVVQVIIAVVAVLFSAAVTAVIALALKATVGWRISVEDEVAGIDQAVHAESGYDFGQLGGGGFRPGAAAAPATRASQQEVTA
jgi:Amt family ammonium transporter